MLKPSPSPYAARRKRHELRGTSAARRLLETTDTLVADIATETGFFDQSHLTKLFKHERGITPGEYRRRHRSQAK